NLVAAGRGDELAVGAELGDSDGSGVVLQVMNDVAGVARPDLDGLVGAGGDDLRAVIVESGGPDGIRVSLEIARLPDDSEVPQANDKSAGTGGEWVPLVVEGEGFDVLAVGFLKSPDLFPLVGTPLQDFPTDPAGEQGLAVLAEDG